MDKATRDILIVFIVYMLTMVLVGVFFYRKKLTVQQYFLGGRNLNPWVTALSAQASDMSGWLLTGLPGLAYLGIMQSKEAVWTAIGLALGTLVNWLVVAKRLRVYTEISGNAQTIPEYLENRFKDKKGIISLISAIVILFFFTIYASSMFSAGAKLFSNIFGLNYTVALTIGMVVIVSYTFLGGFLAVSWTDLFQGLLMFLCIIVLPFFMLNKMGSSENNAISGTLAEIGKLFSANGNKGYGYMVIGAVGWGLGYFGMPHVLTRFMGSKSKDTIKQATIIATVWVVLSLVGAVLIGIMGSQLIPGLKDSEQVFMESVKYVFTPFIAGIMLCAMLAAIMSTADSQLLVASSSFANDIYKKFINKKASPKQQMRVSRLTIIILSVVAYLLALDPNSSVFEVVKYAWAGLGASFGPIIVLSLYNKNITAKGAFAGIATGASVTLVWKYGLSLIGGFFQLYELIPGFILSFIVILVVSKFDKKKNPDIIKEEYEAMQKEVAIK